MSGQRGKAGLLLTMTLEERRELHRQARAAHLATARYVMNAVREACGLGAGPARKAETVTSRLRRLWRYPGDPRLPRADVGASRAIGGEDRATPGSSVPGADAGPERPGRAGTSGEGGA
jgi:hypothetical protein